MIPRRQLDIGFGDLARAAWVCLRREAPLPRCSLLERDDALASLTVRSAFDLMLSALALPSGSEVLVSAITIPDMVRILRMHGLVPVPVDIDPETLSIDAAALEARATHRTRAVLVTHLFGSVCPVEPLLRVARARGLWVWEDCAQAFRDGEAVGHPESDARFYSFGMLKTASAAGGAVTRMRSRELRERMRALQESWPRQSRSEFFVRVVKVVAFKALLHPRPYALWVGMLRRLGRDHDVVLARAAKAFPEGSAFLVRSRRRPSHPLLWLLHRRLAAPHGERVAARARLGASLAARIGGSAIGARATDPTYWVFPVFAPDPDALVAVLRAEGFDASRASTSVCVVPTPAERPEAGAPRAEQLVRHIVYVPLYVGMPGVERLGEILCAHAARALEGGASADSATRTAAGGA